MPPPVEDVSDEESGDIPFRDAPEHADDESKEEDGNKESDEDEDEDDGEEDEDVYVVEKIAKHDWLDDGTLKLFVKWKGYDAIKDHTWEDEEGLVEGARDIVMAYYASIGGRPVKPEVSEKPKPGRKRKSMGDSTPKTSTPKPAESKRQRKSAGSKVKEASGSEEPPQWLPKGKNWDKDIKEVSTIMRGEDKQGLFAYLLFKNGRTARVDVQVCYSMCPLKMLEFYESHLVFKDEKGEPIDD